MRNATLLRIAATGGRAPAPLQSLRNAGYVEHWDGPRNPSGRDRVRVTEAGKAVLHRYLAARERERS